MTDNNQSTQESEQKVMDANRSARENEPKAIDNNQAAQESEPRLADTNQSVEDGTQEVDDTDQAAGEDANEEIDFDDLAEADANQVANTPSAFPSFKDGDVLIVLAADIIFQLHSEVLRRSSKVLASLLIEENAVKLLPKAKRKGTTTRWRLDLKRHNFNMKRPGVFELEVCLALLCFPISSLLSLAFFLFSLAILSAIIDVSSSALLSSLLRPTLTFRLY